MDRYSELIDLMLARRPADTLLAEDLIRGYLQQPDTAYSSSTVTKHQGKPDEQAKVKKRHNDTTATC